jgi:hypothetical protein
MGWLNWLFLPSSPFVGDLRLVLTRGIYSGQGVEGINSVRKFKILVTSILLEGVETLRVLAHFALSQGGPFVHHFARKIRLTVLLLGCI